MIPDFHDGLHLPDGDHPATLQEVRQRFGAGGQRQEFCTLLEDFVEQAAECGFVKVYLFGSFISGKPVPGDVDLMWVYERDLDLETLSPECRDLLDYNLMRTRVGWDMFCCSDDEVV